MTTRPISCVDGTRTASSNRILARAVSAVGIVEQLEERRLLSVTYDSATHQLTIVGTASNDDYLITRKLSGAKSSVMVTENGVTYRYQNLKQPIFRINADLGDGNDRFLMGSTLLMPAYVNGGEGNDVIFTALGNDLVSGYFGNDIINGGPGRDTLLGSAGIDLIRGGLGNDVITGDSDDDILWGNQGNDYIDGGRDSDDLIFGGTGDDTLHGSEGNDTVYGEQGLDSLYGETGADHLYGGPDVDYLQGDEDADVLWGGTEDDELRGNEGRDTLNGDDGNDVLMGQNGQDELNGGLGNDDLNGGDEDDLLNGGDDDDTLGGGNGNDTLNGDDGVDSLSGDDGNDSLSGGEDDDDLSGGLGEDTLLGNDGADTLAGNENGDFLSGGNGADQLQGGDGPDEAHGDDGNDVINGGDDNDSLFGEAGNDLIRGGTDNDELHGMNGDDSLYGGGGDDVLEAGFGFDGLYGAAGIDTLTGGDDADRFLDNFTRGLFGIKNWEDDITDKQSEDARIGLEDGDIITVDFAGQSGSFTFAAGNWVESEVEQLDLGLAALHHATQNKQLLETRAGGTIELVRHGAQTSATGTFNAGAWNSGHGTIHFIDASFDGVGKTPDELMIHEIGHNWDEEYDQSGWESQSGWVQQDTSPGVTFVQGSDADVNWWFDTTQAGFVSTYAQTNPDEDFAESFCNYFMNLGGLTFTGDGGGSDISFIPAKEAFFDQFVVDLS